MKKIAPALLISTALTLSACGQAGQQWWDPDKTFALFDQPEVKGVNDTQEEMAKEAFAAGDYSKAAQNYQQLIASNKAKPDQILRYKMGMAESTRRLGSNEEALAMYEELYRETPNNVDVLEGRGLTLMATGKPVDAGRMFSEVIEKDPKRWRSLNALGILFVSKNMIPEAIAYYTEALNNSPDNAAVLNNVGLSYAVDRNFPRGIEALQQASRVSKIPAQRKQIDLNLAMVHGVSGDMEAARDVASKYIEGPALDNNLGLYAHLAKNDNLARTYLNMALSQSPTYYERAWENLGVVNDAGGNSDAGPALGRPKSHTPLPKIERLEEPVMLPEAAPAVAPAPVVEKPRSAPKKPAKKAKAPAAAVEAVNPNSELLSPTPPSQPLYEMPKTVTIPSVKPSTQPRSTSDKPAGLVVSPGE